MMTLRQRLFIIISIVVGVIIVLVLGILFATRWSNRVPTSPEDDVDSAALAEQVDVAEVAQRGVPAPSVNVEEARAVVQQEMQNGEFFARQNARLFVERYGSYSNQNNNKHIEDVLPLVTSGMASWLETQRVERGVEYYGVTTRVVSSNVTSFEEGVSAAVSISAQEEITNGETTTKYKEGTVNLVKQGNDWLVSSLYWEE